MLKGWSEDSFGGEQLESGVLVILLLYTNSINDPPMLIWSIPIDSGENMTITDKL
jgi:hypothetical protein